MLLLNKYVIKRGLKASLIDQDRYLVALTCYFISAKANSQFIRSKDLLEYYYLNRPMGNDQASLNNEQSMSGAQGYREPCLGSPAMSTAAERN